MSEPRDPRFRVVVNDEEQYSIWPAGRQLPDGWSDEGAEGTESACVAHIEKTWVDMRPRSLRERRSQEAR